MNAKSCTEKVCKCLIARKSAGLLDICNFDQEFILVWMCLNLYKGLKHDLVSQLKEKDRQQSIAIELNHQECLLGQASFVNLIFIERVRCITYMSLPR